MAEMPDVTRWNVQRDGDALLICEGDHERHEGCTFNRYIRADLVDELVKALEPFVDALEGNDDSNIRDSAEIWEAPLAMNITYGHLRRAHAALTRIKGDGK